MWPTGQEKVTAGTLAYYAKRMAWSGRQVGSRWTKYDALATKAGKIPEPLSER